jgi:hypothetical protein
MVELTLVATRKGSSAAGAHTADIAMRELQCTPQDDRGTCSNV